MLPYYKEEEEASLHRQLSQRAVELVVQGHWKEAEAVNRGIIDDFPTDVEAHNRLGRVLIELGDFVKAKEAYTKALELDPNNAIAKRNLARLSSLPESVTTVANEESRVESKLSAETRGIAPDLFVAETGKAGILKLHNMASSDILAKLVIGDWVKLKVEGQRLIVQSEQGDYIGEVEIKFALRLIKLINSGNRYDAAISNMGTNEGYVIIKETYQHPNQLGHLPFPIKDTITLRPHTRDSFLRRSVDALGNREGEVEENSEIEYIREEAEAELDGFTVLEEGAASGNKEEIA
ncbi:MAG: tetratricopeptide repeat protein [Chloroflexota bacterium]|nr:tetratricopeptide repeat protein [Chloroflexota bacterium]